MNDQSSLSENVLRCQMQHPSCYKIQFHSLLMGQPHVEICILNGGVHPVLKHTSICQRLAIWPVVSMCDRNISPFSALLSRGCCEVHTATSSVSWSPCQRLPALMYLYRSTPTCFHWLCIRNLQRFVKRSNTPLMRLVWVEFIAKRTKEQEKMSKWVITNKVYSAVLKKVFLATVIKHLQI